MNLKNKVVLVTGGSRGIGASICKDFSKKGCKVVVCYKNDELSANKVVGLCNKDSFSLKLDVCSDSSIKNCVDFLLKKNLQVDILVNNAGVIRWKRFENQSFDDLNDQVFSNFLGLMKNTLSFLPFLKQKKSAIILNISSIAAEYAPEELAPYSGTKAAVKVFTKALSKELPDNIKIYGVSPGLTSTDMTNHKGVSPEKVSKVVIGVCSGDIFLESGADIDVRNHY
ncbi:SDR family oxidoreductase [Candidatus Woesearchaeota archaeon]|nr:SDR family oxidoreductase [Candidatus Woesearchaeota archaeon]